MQSSVSPWLVRNPNGCICRRLAHWATHFSRFFIRELEYATHISGIIGHIFSFDPSSFITPAEPLTLSPSGQLQVARSRRSDEEILLSLTGELDIESARTLAQILGAAENAGAARLLLDVSGVDFIDSAGITVLVRAQSDAAEVDRQFVLTKLSPSVSRFIDVAGLSGHFTIA
jgi:anti-anti-sigma factor